MTLQEEIDFTSKQIEYYDGFTMDINSEYSSLPVEDKHLISVTISSLNTYHLSLLARYFKNEKDYKWNTT